MELRIARSNDSLLASPAVAWQWYLNGLPIPLANGQSFVPQQAGNYMVEIVDADGCNAFSDSLNFAVGSLEHLVFEGLVFPNPFQNEIRIEGTFRHLGKTDLRIFDVYGKTVFQEELVVKGGYIRQQVALPDLPHGVYFLELMTDKGHWLVKIARF